MWLVSQPVVLALQTVKGLKVPAGTSPSPQAGPEENAGAKEPQRMCRQQRGAWDSGVRRRG